MFTISAKNTIMQSLFVGQTTIPCATYIGLSEADPGLDGTGITEPAAHTGYSRVATNGAFQVQAGSHGLVSNTLQITFPTFIADAGLINYYVLYDQNNNPFWYAPLQVQRIADRDTTLAFKAGDLMIALQDAM